jgi:seryl-tRNA synthetase
MHDIRLIRDNPEAFDAGLARRGLSPMADDLIALDEKRRAVITELQEKQARRNEASREMGLLRSGNNPQKVIADAMKENLLGRVLAVADEMSKPARIEALQKEAQELKAAIPKLETQERELNETLNVALSEIPNLPLRDVPSGANEEDNELVHTRGKLPNFDFQQREHDAIGQALGLDFETGVALAGARFTLVRGAAARLNRALGQFGLDVLTKHHGYEEIVPPLLVRSEAMFGTGQLPKFAEDLFQTTDGRWLIPTAEVSLTNIVREKILAAAELPLRFTALTPCFRSEAGAAGRDTRGFIRQHQFEKAEMVSIVPPDQSEAEHERMTAAAEDVLTRLCLPFRRMKLCTGDMGFSAARTYDLEVWLPGQGRYREISSCSTCTDFQARRMNARFRGEDGKPAFVHTLNGSGLVVGRMMVAILENYQQEDGSVAIPDALQPYLGGLNRLEPAS